MGFPVMGPLKLLAAFSLCFCLSTSANAASCGVSLKTAAQHQWDSIRAQGKNLRRALAIASLVATAYGVASGTPLLDDSVTWDEYITELQDSLNDYPVLMQLILEDLQARLQNLTSR